MADTETTITFPTVQEGENPNQYPCIDDGVVHDPDPDNDGTCGLCGLGNAWHIGHRAWLGSGWWCDTCDSPLCDLA